MNWSDIYLLCFVIGALWSLVSLLLGGLHLHLPKVGFHGSHTAHVSHGVHAHHGHAPGKAGSHAQDGSGSLLGALINPSCVAIFLVWFGGAGYLMLRHSALAFGLGLAIAASIGLVGALVLASFLRFLQSREQSLDPADYEMVGVLGQVSSTIRSTGVGEVIYLRDGARRPLCARSEDGLEIPRGEEVVVTRYEKGIAYVRTWEAMTQ